MHRSIEYHYSFFNGDADGICATIQFILSGYNIKHFVTGHKRDQALLRHGKHLYNKNILVLDIAVEKNFNHLKTLLQNKCIVTWFDHHGAGEELEFTKYNNFFPNINISSNVNTSLLVYNFLNDIKLLQWAIVGLFGDNMNSIANAYCTQLDLLEEQRLILSDIGKYINYNSYGLFVDELIIHPNVLLNKLKLFQDPISFYTETNVIQILKRAADSDLELSLSYYKGDNIIFLPNKTWALRAYGVLLNQLTLKDKLRPYTVLVERDNGYLVSVRAPRINPVGAGDLCSLFSTGGGRAGSGGINNLPKHLLNNFIDMFKVYWILNAN